MAYSEWMLCSSTMPHSPPQALLHSSHLYHEATHNMASHGISMGEVSIDVGKMMDSKASKVEALTGGIEYLCKKYEVRRRERVAYD